MKIMRGMGFAGSYGNKLILLTYTKNEKMHISQNAMLLYEMVMAEKQSGTMNENSRI